MLRGSRGDAAGTELGSSFVERITVNVGTALGPARCPCSPARVSGWAHRRLIGSGRDGAAVVLRAGESPCTWGRAAAVSRRDGGCNAERCAGEYRRLAGTPLWGRAGGYRRCRPNFTVGRWPIPAAGSMTCSTSCMTRRRCWWRSTGSRATTVANTPGVDGLTVADVEEASGCPGSWTICEPAEGRARFGRCRCGNARSPSRVGRESCGKLGIPTVADRVVQAALKLVLEPIFEADFEPVSYGFRPMRRAQDAIAEIHQYGTQGYRWVLDADIEACFDSIDHIPP